MSEKGKIPEGYKQTEIGIIPEDWDIKTIGDVADVISGGTPSTIHPEYWNGNIPWMNSGELNQKRVNAIQGRITNEGLNNSSTVMVPPGCVLIGLAGQGKTRGTVAMNGVTLCINQSIAAIFPNARKYNSEYLYQNLNDRYNELREISSGDGGRGGLNCTIIRNLSIWLPPLPEQHAIAEVLSDMDGYIVSLEKLIAKKKAIKQGARQELLTGKRRLPGFDGEWENIELGELLEYEQPTDYIVRSTKYTSSGIPVLTAGKSFILGYTVEQEGIHSKYPVILFDDFLTISRYIDFPFKVKSSAVKLLKNKREHDSLKLIFELMQMIEFTVVDHQRHWISRYSKIQLRLPLPEEQTAIATILSDMDTEIDALTAKLNKAKLIKKGMMQELLTGRIRLVKSETTAIPITKVLEFPKNGKVAKRHNQAIEDAVILGVITDLYTTEQYPLAPFYSQKLPYLLHRHMEGKTEGYKKKAAGPYNPTYRYRTALPIATKNSYVIGIKATYNGKPYLNLVIGNNIDKAKNYFLEWHGEEPLKWLEQFRYIKNRRDELELLTTVDMAMVELRAGKMPVIMSAVKEIIQNSAEWKAKLKRNIFSDENIARAIAWSIKLFGEGE
jgi:type I restriction enzyme S subunit